MRQLWAKDSIDRPLGNSVSRVFCESVRMLRIFRSISSWTGPWAAMIEGIEGWTWNNWTFPHKFPIFSLFPEWKSQSVPAPKLWDHTWIPYMEPMQCLGVFGSPLFTPRVGHGSPRNVVIPQQNRWCLGGFTMESLGFHRKLANGCWSPNRWLS